ncbi:MAG: FAD-dependent pyridine nucleotide-disulfide oxidoreductase [Thermoleophilia bacterium]|nr:FAD-dependent pyridine nucleotide-disulfide oxidoreductase [Thermoleophilia bacterium]
MDTSSSQPVHRIVIIGGGFGGVRAARALSKLPVQVTLLDRTNHHLFQPLLYQVATGILSPGQVAPALRSLFRRRANVRVLLGAAEHVDLDARTVRVLGDGPSDLPYDTLVVAAGATHSYFGHDEWSNWAPGMKTLDDANRLRSRILGAFELAEQEDEPARRESLLTFVVVGAGPTGVELAGQISVLARRILPGEYRSIDPSQARVILLDAAPTVLGAFHERSRARASRDLAGLGVELQLGAMAVDIDGAGITVQQGEQRRTIASRTVIWAAGVEASPLGRQLATDSGAEVDRAGRVAVEPDCTLPGRPEVFIIGDMASLPGVPGVAQPAIQQGAYVAKVIGARLRGAAAPAPFRYRDKGTMATIGRTRAVAEVGGLRFAGFPAFLLWGVVHLAYLVGWGNRAEAVTRWMWTLMARNRRERLISVVSLASREQGEAQLRALLPARAASSGIVTPHDDLRRTDDPPRP